MPVTGDIVAALQAENAALRERLRLLEDAARPFAILATMTGGQHEESPLYDAWSDSTIEAGLNCGHARRLAACLDAGDQPTKGEWRYA